MAFLETPRFPEGISFRSAGGPRYEVSIITVESGYEQANLEQDEPLHRWDVEHGIKHESDLYSVLTFFHATRGPFHRFRYKDWSDFNTGIPGNRAASNSSTDMNMNPAVGDGSRVEFQLEKQYVKGALSTARTIKKPVSGTILVAVNAVDQTETTDYTIDYTTGLVTFTTAPTAGHPVKWGGQFDVPARFETQRIETSWAAHIAGSQSIIVREVRI